MRGGGIAPLPPPSGYGPAALVRKIAAHSRASQAEAAKTPLRRRCRPVHMLLRLLFLVSSFMQIRISADMPTVNHPAHYLHLSAKVHGSWFQ